MNSAGPGAVSKADGGRKALVFESPVFRCLYPKGEVYRQPKMKKWFPTVRAYENAHIALWLLKDFCWCRGLHVLGMVMIIPTLSIAVDITWSNRRLENGALNIHDLFHNVAVALWICANATWMTGEFFFGDSWRPLALVFFGSGLGLIAWYYLFMFRKPHLAA